jgi:hypothetical protein
LVDKSLKFVIGRQICYWWTKLLLVDNSVIGRQIYYW